MRSTFFLGIEVKKYLLAEDLFFEGIKNQPIKDKLKKLTNHAFERNVFGAPTFYVNNKLFWGQDRLQYAIAESVK